MYKSYVGDLSELSEINSPLENILPHLEKIRYRGTQLSWHTNRDSQIKFDFIEYFGCKIDLNSSYHPDALFKTVMMSIMEDVDRQLNSDAGRMRIAANRKYHAYDALYGSIDETYDPGKRYLRISYSDGKTRVFGAK